MTMLRARPRRAKLDYPESDGKPMGETPTHRDNLAYIIEMLRGWYEDWPKVYVSGNMFVYYVRGNREKSVVPDVFVVKGVPKEPVRRVFKIWKEKPLDLIIEITSRASRDEDQDDKLGLYQDVLKVPEYFLFDPLGEYLDPTVQGYRLVRGKYEPIRPVQGRLPSKVLGLHLEIDSSILRLWDPGAKKWLLTPPEERIARMQAEAARLELEAAGKRAEGARLEAEAAQKRLEAENQRLRLELENLSRRAEQP